MTLPEPITAPRKRKFGRWILLGVLVAGVAGAGIYFRTGEARAVSGIPGTYDDSSWNTVAPQGVRIRVEVQNATKTRGLGRRATLYLRDRGFDVVSFGNAAEQRDSTLVLDRSGHAAWARAVAKAMRARIESRPDTSRYLDVTVLVGADWRPPPIPFYP